MARCSSLISQKARMQNRKLKLAIVVSHPIQHFDPWHRQVATDGNIDLKVFFCCDWGIKSYDDPGFGQSVKWDIPLREGYDSQLLPIRKRPRRLSFFSVDNPTIAEQLASYKPDVVQIFGYAYRTNLRAVRWCRANAIPVLLYSDSNIRAQVVGGIRTRLKHFMVRQFYRRIDGALYVGDNNREYHLFYGLPEERLFPGCLPVDIDRLREQVPEPVSVRAEIKRKYSIPERSFVAVFSGKLIARKRPFDFVCAIKAACEHESNIYGVIVGDGAERAALEAYCKTEKIDQVRFAGFINQSEISCFYAAGNVLIVSSSFDPHPLVVTEAAAFGLPLILSDAVGCIGPTDTAQPDRNAFVYECGEVKQLSERIIQLASSPRLASKFSEASRAIAETQDIKIASDQLSDAVTRLSMLGPRI
jgi:glycosyltransferase involved in cell wall biosynthesis